MVNPDVMLPPKNGKLDVGGAVGIGLLTGHQRYGTKGALCGTDNSCRAGEIAEDLTYYFATSEQVPSSVGLGVLMDKGQYSTMCRRIYCSGDAVCQRRDYSDQLEENLKDVHFCYSYAG